LNHEIHETHENKHRNGRLHFGGFVIWPECGFEIRLPTQSGF
jgi:hypothetical protein